MIHFCRKNVQFCIDNRRIKSILKVYYSILFMDKFILFLGCFDSNISRVLLVLIWVYICVVAIELCPRNC